MRQPFIFDLLFAIEVGVLGEKLTIKKLKTLEKSRVFSFSSLVGEHHGSTSYFRTTITVESYYRTTPISY